MNFALAAFLLASLELSAQTSARVLVVENRKSAASREIGGYYVSQRSVPAGNVCNIDTAPLETITREVYVKEIETPVGNCLRSRKLEEKILYIVLTAGVPLIVAGAGDKFQNEEAAVDSELTLLYQKLHGAKLELPGPITNPFFRQRDAPFEHPLFPIYLVTRLDGYDMKDMKGLVDRALVARNRGTFVIDMRAGDTDPAGNQWLRAAALLLPRGRVVSDDSVKVLSDLKDVIGYASWGSNDSDRKHRFLHYQWLPGAIATEFVSTDARTFRKPPDTWELGTWRDRKTWYAGAPQSLTADYVHDGASGVAGQVDEPYLGYCPRPEFVLPAYAAGRNLAESFYMGIPGLSWMNVVIGDPLMKLQ